MRGQLGHQRGLGHAGLRVDLQHDELTRTSGAVVVAEIGTTDAATSESAMRP